MLKKPFRFLFSQHEGVVFIYMFVTFLLLQINYALLRSVRSTLSVVDLHGSAKLMPCFDLIGTLPCAILMAGILARMLRRYSITQVFCGSVAAFVAFFIGFVAWIYPLVAKSDSVLAARAVSMTFHVISELWKPALILVLFWGLLNQYVPLKLAKKFYGPLAIAGSLGAVLAGPINSFCMRASWSESLSTLVGAIAIVSFFATMTCFRLSRILKRVFPIQEKQSSKPMTFKSSLKVSWQVPELRLMGWIVIADYIAYSLGEVIFFAVLKMHLPLANDYCLHMGKLSFWSGLLTLAFSCIIPVALRKMSLCTIALVTPVCLFLTQGIFFALLCFRTTSYTLAIAALTGSIMFCLCRSTKSTFFDTAKELAFITFSNHLKMRGKLVIDGICARFGRAGAAGLSIGLIALSGGVLASSLVSALISIGFTLSWLIKTPKIFTQQQRGEI